MTTTIPKIYVAGHRGMVGSAIVRQLLAQGQPAERIITRKLMRVIQGEVFDVSVDLRRTSPTFGQWVGVHLSADNHRQLWVPPGFAHGFVVLSDSAEFLYKTTDYWYPEHERSLLWNDPAIGIDWPLYGPPLLAAKDAAGKLLAEAECFD